MPAKHNKYAGEIYGKLTAIKETGDTHLRSNKWLLKCVCGVEVVRKLSDVRRAVKKGQIPSCGCHIRKDFKGKRIGMLEALEWTGRLEDHGAIWTFKCDCGNHIEKLATYTLSGSGKRHCGCRDNMISKHVDHSGKTFGDLTALKTTGSLPKHGIVWLCKCSCGNEVEVTAKRLNNNTKTHCGCKSKEGIKSNTFRGIGTLSKTYVTRLEKNAIARNLVFDIDIEFLWELYNTQNGKCALSGVEIPLGPVKNMIGSVDRIDSNIGYTKENVQWVHKELNLMKMTLTNEKFKEWCKYVAEFNK